ncbi:hypothetical protein KI387_022467 [Taxus chinensis]|uniref:Alpha/beta hydrolase fold-3 domain-containing protein n=1 Tax=Taxus chinensis TaxID=29808 RepID=A0AA38G153_TAXCH|nr:hypothetical protein KI387_022467 [Taxus chinensis]
MEKARGGLTRTMTVRADIVWSTMYGHSRATHMAAVEEMVNNYDCAPLVVEEIPGLIKVYSDRSVVWQVEPSIPAAEDKVLYKDDVFDEEIHLWTCLYLPKTKTKSRVPVFLHFHASEFCVLSPDSPAMHRMCHLWAAKLGVIIISVKYRLAPENRLPAAYHDSIAAFKWLEAMKKGGAVADPWLQSHSDFSKIFVMGESAVGNIVHHLGMWASAEAENGMEIKIKGMILLYPYFGGEDRMPSEEGGLSRFPLEYLDAFWRLALPVGSNKDHPFCNPVGKHSEDLDSGVSIPPMLFVVPGRDMLRDKQLQYCEFPKKKCVKEVEVVLLEDEDHGFIHVNVDGQSSVELHRCISDFIK